MMPTLLQMSASSGRMWLETMMVLPSLPSSLSRPRISMRARGSRPLAGSSSSSTLGSCSSTRARPSRCVMPRERLVTQRVALVAEVDQVEHFVADFAARGAFDAIGGGEELEVLDHLHVVVHAEEVGHVADQPADFLGMGVDRVAADAGLAPGRLQERGQDAHRRGLARAVGADEPEQVALGSGPA